jgi:hypothetical protein
LFSAYHFSAILIYFLTPPSPVFNISQICRTPAGLLHTKYLSATRKGSGTHQAVVKGKYPAILNPCDNKEACNNIRTTLMQSIAEI